MIDFSLTDEQKALQEVAREFSENEIKPNAARYDKGEEFPEDVMKKAFDIGFLMTIIPKEYGGGHTDIENIIASEELAAGCAGLYCIMMVNAPAHTPVILKDYPLENLMRDASCFRSMKGRTRSKGWSSPATLSDRSIRWMRRSPKSVE